MRPEALRPTGGSAPSPQDEPPVAILAGGGSLPVEIAQALAAAGRLFHIVAIDGHADAALGRWPISRVNIAQVGGMLAAIRRNGCRELVIAGGLRRPDLASLRVDLGTFRYAPALMSLMKGGDDSLLRKVVRFFEAQGLRVVGVPDVAASLLASEGALAPVSEGGAGHDPAPYWASAVARARAAIHELSPFDVGQAVVATSGRIVAIEGADGTDEMLRRLISSERTDEPCVLVKMPKLGQERRIDLPAIGPDTVRRAAEAGVSAIMVEAGATIVIGRAETIVESQRLGIPVVGLAPAQSAGARPTLQDTTAAAAEPPLVVRGRHAPSPRDRRDARLGLALLRVLDRHGAGSAALVVRRHVLAIGEAGSAEQLIERARRIRPWRGLLRQRLGVLAVAPTEALVSPELVAAIAAAGFSGAAIQGAGPIEQPTIHAADRARVVLLSTEAAVAD